MLSAVASLVIIVFKLAYVVAVLNIEEAPETVSRKSSCTMNAIPEHIH